VAAAQDRVLVGAPNSDVGAQDAGAAFLFEASTGIFLKSFQKSTRSVGDYFGWSVGAIGDNILVGAIGDDAGALNAGAVYLFDAGTGSMLRDFKNPDPGDTDQFGLSLACLDGKVIVGAPYDDTGAQDSGAAYLIATATGELVHVFANPTPALSDYFGWSVSFIGSDVIVGSPFDDAGGADAGVAYLFTQIATVQGGTGGGAAGRAL